jgi:hypothetical protein
MLTTVFAVPCRMLEECPTIVRWDAGSLCVLDPAALQQSVLPRYFRTARKSLYDQCFAIHSLYTSSCLHSNRQ